MKTDARPADEPSRTHGGNEADAASTRPPAASGRQLRFMAGASSRGLSSNDVYAVGFGLFLGLSLVKFGNPVILDQAIAPPATLHEAWVYAWPGRWSYWFLVPLALVGAGMGVTLKPRWSCTRWLWVLPITWFGWQLVSATQTVDGHLTAAALGQFGGCLACYFSGALLLGSRHSLHWLLIGLLAAFTFCLVRAVNQRLFEYPQERRLLLEGERTGWTNFAPDFLAQLKRENVIIATNGIDVANPLIMAKYAKGRVNGTLTYPNALAGAVLLLWPVSLAIAFSKTRHFRALTRTFIVALTLFLGCAGFFWSGSKLAWLIAVAMLCVWLLRLNRPWRWKTVVLAGVILAGAVVFAVRFQDYFAAGAKSAGARLGYWRAAVQITRERPLAGSGPGTFQKPYAQLKAPDAEMARLAHNDYLEQFSDSGIVGGMSYLAWIVLALVTTGRRVWRFKNPVPFAILSGLVGWFVQGLGEFSLYIPGLAWPAFTLLGWLMTRAGNQIDKSPVSG